MAELIHELGERLVELVGVQGPSKASLSGSILASYKNATVVLPMTHLLL